MTDIRTRQLLCPSFKPQTFRAPSVSSKVHANGGRTFEVWVTAAAQGTPELVCKLSLENPKDAIAVAQGYENRLAAKIRSIKVIALTEYGPRTIYQHYELGNKNH